MSVPFEADRSLQSSGRAPDKSVEPLVVGAPRTGFTLLINVVSRLLVLTRRIPGTRQRVLNVFANAFGDRTSVAICNAFAERGIGDDLVYSPNFRLVTGGPKWLHDNPSRACFRKYIGVRGMGDFTLITSHPHQLLGCDEIVHSHSHPRRWLEHPAYSQRVKLASVRNPVGTINSACFSINALTSEYIQRFLPAERDNDELREHLALYKLTDLEFFTGLIKPLKAYLQEYLECRGGFIEMRWEDLISLPVRTIMSVGDALGLPVEEEYASGVWAAMGYKNLTGAHAHNYRKGHGIVNGWRRTLTNEHLELMRQAGMEEISVALGYGRIPDLDEAIYTPFQRTVADLLRKGKVFNDYPDQDLFEFAFNKSNLAGDFHFKRYGWRENTQVERSSFSDEAILDHVWGAAESAVATFNEGVTDLISGDYSSVEQALAHVRDVVKMHGSSLGEPPAIKEALATMETAIRAPMCDDPRLLSTIGNTNIVFYDGRFLALPQSLGPRDLRFESVDHLPGVYASQSFREVVARVRRASTEPST